MVDRRWHARDGGGGKARRDVDRGCGVLAFPARPAHAHARHADPWQQFPEDRPWAVAASESGARGGTRDARCRIVDLAAGSDDEAVAAPPHDGVLGSAVRADASHAVHAAASRWTSVRMASA